MRSLLQVCVCVCVCDFISAQIAMIGLPLPGAVPLPVAGASGG